MPSNQDRLRVFISSRMTELTDLRAVVYRELQRLGIEAFVYEAVQGAVPDDPETASLREVSRCDVFVLVIGGSWGEITEREYDKAREISKPCLVYERLGNKNSDLELERFLKKISGPRGVPSRSSFQNAVDLAEKVAQDVQGWLVREYRRLSAAQLAADDSSLRASELEVDMNRLAGSTSRSLERGDFSDLLAWQLRQWFEALDYPLEREPELGNHYTDLYIRVPERRRQYKQTLVRAKDGAIESSDVERASELLRGSVQEVWLVSYRRISPAAKEEAARRKSVLLYTLDELVEEDVSFDSYFEWLDEQVRKADIDRLYVPLAVTVNEVDKAGEFRTSSTYDDVAVYVDQWLQDTDREHLSLLGEFGTGKSWFALKYAHDMVQDYRRAQKRGLQRPRLPLVIRLREYARGFKDVGALLTEFVFREHEIRIQSVRVLETLNRMGRLLFIFDGFDEMAARVDQQKMVDNFWSLASILGPGSKAILTCRSEYFRFAQQAREVLGGKLRGSFIKGASRTAKFQVATLNMLDEPRIRKVFSLRLSDPVLIESVLVNPKLVDLARRPIMIDLLLEAMPYLPAERIDLAQVYYQAVKRKMERDITSERTFTSMADKVFFMCEISWEMLSANSLKIHYKEVPATVRAYFGSQAGTAADEDYWRHDLLSQTLLVRDDDGYYHPAHKSLIEFFSAYKLSAAIGALQDRYIEAVRGHQGVSLKLAPKEKQWSEFFLSSKRPVYGSSVAPLARFQKESADRLATTWGRVALNDSISEMIYLLSGRDGLTKAVRDLNASDENEVASRVLESAAFSGRLSSIDLSGAALRGCKLNNCDLSNSDLSNSVWTGGMLRGVSLEGAVLRGARLDGTSFHHVNLRAVDLSNSDFSGSKFHYIEIAGAYWCTRKSDECLIVVLDDGRMAAILPDSAAVMAIETDQIGWGYTAGSRIEALSQLSGDCEISVLGKASFLGIGWRVAQAWQLAVSLEPGLRFEQEIIEYASGDVEVLNVIVKGSRGELILEQRIVDASYLSGSGTRALTISRTGQRFSTVHGLVDGAETAQILGAKEEDKVDLYGFSGWGFPIGPDTFDNRGASFSPTEAVLAICERPGVLGFWRSDSGAFLGRVMFHYPCEGCITDGARGLPSWLSGADSSWKFETNPLEVTTG